MFWANNKNKRAELLFFAGLIIHTILNVYTAANIGVHFDEAYYWMYSQHPEWGFFDHPPMVAWFILLSQFFFKGLMGLRFITLVSSTLSVILIWEMVKRYKPDAILFWTVMYSVMLIHPYSFIATPDAPLFFFTVLFFYLYQQYLRKDNFCNIILLAFTIALMLYSKYHGILIVGFVVLSNLKLLKKWTFWALALLSLVYLSPHIFWQIRNDYPTLQYHLVDSHKTGFQFSVILDYLYGQFLLAGPFLGWLWFYAMWKTPNSDPWERGLKVAGLGTFIFFFVSTIMGDNEAHWTLIAFVPLIILAFKYLTEHTKWQKWVTIGALVNFALLLAVRILITTPAGENLKPMGLYFGWKESSLELKEHAGNRPVVFQDTWNFAARYAYYTQDKSIANLNSAYHRPNQFDLWRLEEDLFGKTVYLVSKLPDQFTSCDSVKTKKLTWYGTTIENFRSYYRLGFELDTIHWQKDSLHIRAKLINPYDEPIIFNDTDTKAYLQIVAPYKKRYKVNTQVFLAKQEIPIKGSINLDTVFVIPENTNLDRARLVLKIGELNPIPVWFGLPEKPKE